MVFFTRRFTIGLLITLAALAAGALPLCGKIISHPSVEHLLSYEGEYGPGQAQRLTTEAQIYCIFLSLSCVALTLLVRLRRRVRAAGAYLALILLLGLVLRAGCIFTFEGGPNVHNFSVHFVERMNAGGNPYLEDELHYPPVHLTYLQSANLLTRATGIALHRTVRMPWAVFDILSALLVYLLLRHRGAKERTALFAAAVMALSPYVIANSSYQGDADSAWIFWTLFAVYVLLKREDRAGLVVSALLLGVGIASKPIPLLAAVPLALSRKCWRDRILYGVLTVAPLVALTGNHLFYENYGFYGHLTGYEAAYGSYGLPSFVKTLLRFDVYSGLPALNALDGFLTDYGDWGWKAALIVMWLALGRRRGPIKQLVATFAIVLALTMRAFPNYFIWLLPFILVDEDALSVPFAGACALYGLVVTPIFISGLLTRDIYVRELMGAPVWMCASLIAVAALSGRDMFAGIEQSLLSGFARILTSMRSRALRVSDVARGIARFVAHRRNAFLGAVFLVAFFARISYVIDNRIYVFPEYHENGMIARNLIAGEGYAGSSHLGGEENDKAATAFMAPGYPLLLAAYFKVIGEQRPELLLVFQSLIGALSCVLLFFVARRATGREETAALAAAAAALSYFLIQSASWMNVAVYTTFLMLVITLVVQGNRDRPSRAKDVLTGALFGVSALVEPVVLSFYPFALLYMRRPKTFPWKRKMLSWTCAILATAVVLAPWSTRNYLTFGKLVPIKSAWWYNFWRGNNPAATGGDRFAKNMSSPQALTPEDWKHIHAAEDEIERYDYLKRRSFAFIRENPGRFLELRANSALFFWTGQNIWHGFAWAPEHPVTLPLNIILFGLAAAGVLVALANGQPGLRFIGIALATFPLPYYLCHADIQYRYRMPMDPYLIIFASLAITAALGRRPAGGEGGADD